MKFRGKYNSADECLSHVEKLVQKILKDLPNAHNLSISKEKYSFTPDLFKGPIHQQRAIKKDSAISIHHHKRGNEIISNTKFRKGGVTQTREGKQHMSTYLAKNAAVLNVRKQTVLDIDSELHISQCTCKEPHCTRKYANTVRCYFDDKGTFVQSEKLEVQQFKGEAEMAQIDWLIQYLSVLNPGSE